VVELLFVTAWKSINNPGYFTLYWTQGLLALLSTVERLNTGYSQQNWLVKWPSVMRDNGHTQSAKALYQNLRQGLWIAPNIQSNSPIERF